MIRKQTEANFVNLEIAIKTYDREASVCGAPAWRFVYHTIHSADKWFFNPSVYEEPAFHVENMDNPFHPCDVVLRDEQLLAYLEAVKEKTLRYLDGLDDEMLYEYPENCEFSRLELMFMQFRHISVHIGLLNGNTVDRTGKFPLYVSPHSYDRLQNGLFERSE